MNVAAYPKYESYHDSGVEWVGAIPARWNVRRGKWLFKKMDRPVRPEDDIVTCFRDGVVTLRANRRTEGFTNALKEHGYQGIRKGDLVIHAMDAFAGAVGVSDSDGKSTPVYSACVPRVEGTVNPRFYAYYMRHITLSGLLVAMAKGIRERSTDFRFGDFADLALAAPPIEEQTAIVAFLDGKCATIDEAVRIKEEQIRLLVERRQILIQEAVTRGLNPDAPMKNSGIDWIGQIPAHWEVKRLRHLGAPVIGLTYDPKDLCDADEGTLVLRSSNLQGGRFTYGDDLNVYVSMRIPEKLKIKRDDILICSRNGSRDLIGKCALATEQDCGASFGAFTTVFRSPINRYLFQILNSEIFKRLAGSFLTATINQLTTSNLNSIYVPVPPPVEQAQLTDYLETLNAKVSDAIALKQSQITALREYKTSLINAAVTGKIKVF